MKNYNLFLISLLTIFINLKKSYAKFADNQNYQKFSINTDSFLINLDRSKNVKYTEYFNNQYLSVGFNLTKSTQIIADTFKNSYNNRYAIFGVE